MSIESDGPLLLDDDIQRSIAAGADRLPMLPGGPFFIAPDSAPPLDAGTLERINPESVGLESVPLKDALSDAAVISEMERITRLGGGLASAVIRIKNKAA